MKLEPTLTKAVRMVKRGKYGDAISLLQPEVVRYHDSYTYYLILGGACLRAGDLGGGFTYFKRAREIKMLEPPALLGMALYHLHRGETEKAVDLYLEVQDLEPRNRIAKKALGVLRKYSGTDALQGWIDSGKPASLFPPLPELPPTLGSIIAPIAGILLTLVLIGGLLVKLQVIPLGKAAETERSGYEGISLESEDRETPVQPGGSYRYILTRNQVLDTYEEARKLFTAYRDEAAKLSLNRLIESNASDGVKNKARLLLSYMDVPGFDTLKDRYPYLEVLKDPALYRNCYVIWRGMAANLDERENGMSFELLVGYDTRTTLEGRVPVVFDFAAPLNLERPLEVLGRVIPVSLPGGEEDIRLEGIALHQASSLGNGRQ
ncbi:tetratricopeptide repeat domain protein [Treponema primitia ZAS-2]|uniref:Tetratricopeptide repeat domain protein n=1 Tax=Treponema primitia (strain ATCC BAA-887 / DSM 12427 / ZAS-2) TaxID=545694 RepID=F5YMU8_TREPZ|nr:tetratricopeptide repeat protein [Treponema primitia]AEF83580.1 tetratricopeptide repeat domain protein [Treponema primitia ZAS-2]